MDSSPVWAVPRGTEGVRIMVAAGLARGLDVAACLDGTGLTERDLEHEDAEVWAHQEFRVIRNLVARLGDRPGLGIEVGEHSTLGRTGVIGFMLLAGPTFLEAVHRAIPFLALSPTHLRFALEVEGERAALVAADDELPADLRAFVIERDMAGLAAALRGAQIDLAPLALETPLDAERAERLGAVWGVGPEAVTPGAAVTRLVLSRATVERRLPQADANTARLFERQCREILADRVARVGVAGQIRSRLLHDPEGWPSMETVAAELHVDLRTLRRALAAEGTSFRRLVDDVRRTRARELLERGAAVAEVARALGYAETATFTRAFTRWEGVAPSRFTRRVS